jgi:DHA2 family multidrug resistance protein
LSLFLVGTLVSEPSGAEEERQVLLRNGLRVDYIGFVLVAIGLGSLEFVLDEGQRKDWFGSNMILGFALASAFCLLALIPWELTRKHPIVDIRLLGRRQFGACFLVMLGTGAVLISTTQLLPQLLQTELGYTAMLAGLALSPGGIFTLMLMPIAGKLVGIVQPKYLIMTGACIVAFAMGHLTGLNSDITYAYGQHVALVGHQPAIPCLSDIRCRDIQDLMLKSGSNSGPRLKFRRHRSGQSVVTRTPCGASSWCSASLNERT